MTEAASKTGTKIKAAKRFSLGAIRETVSVNLKPSKPRESKLLCFKPLVYNLLLCSSGKLYKLWPHEEENMPGAQRKNYKEPQVKTLYWQKFSCLQTIEAKPSWMKWRKGSWLTSCHILRPYLGIRWQLRLTFSSWVDSAFFSSMFFLYRDSIPSSSRLAWAVSLQERVLPSQYLCLISVVSLRGKIPSSVTCSSTRDREKILRDFQVSWRHKNNRSTNCWRIRISQLWHQRNG